MTPRRALRLRCWAAASCLLAMAAGVSVRTSAAGRDPQLEAGIRQVQEGELATALVTLDEAVRHLSQPGASIHELALAHVWSGIARLGMGSRSAAEESMRRAIQADPALTLSSGEFPPNVVLMFDEIRNEVARKAAPATAAPPPAGSTAGAKKGGSAKGLLIGGAVAAVGAGVAVAAGGGGGGGTATTTTTTTATTSTTIATCTDPAGSALPAFQFPQNGATVTGIVTVNCVLPANFPQSCIDFVAYAILPGCGTTFTVIGRPTAPPFQAVWDSRTIANGLHCMECGLWDKQGRPGPVQHVTITISN